MIKYKIGLLLVATGKYIKFVEPLIESVRKYFLLNHNITVYLFTDQPATYFQQTDRVQIVKYPIPSYKFPFATLYRYRIFEQFQKEINEDFVFYSDVDMKFVARVGDEILQNTLVAVHHPGYFANQGWGSSNNSKDSMSYLPVEKRKNYFAGGFQGGKRDLYIEAANILNARIQDDESRGVIAEWNDETHWNWLLNSGEVNLPYIALTPEYCMVEQMNLRKAWGISHLKPKILALEKNHEEVRS